MTNASDPIQAASKASSPIKKATTPKAQTPSTTQTAAKKAPAKVAVTASTKIAPTKTANQVQAKATESVDDSKLKKQKLVRDGFTMPKLEYAVLDVLKLRAAKMGHPVKKSELLRAGVKALNAMNDAALTQALGNVPPIKTGRPKKD
jgi:hypothetical protein